MFLVDTSVWIDYVQGVESPTVNFLDALLAKPGSTGITDQIYLEILQGSKTSAGFDKLQRYFSSQQFYRFRNPQESHEAAARSYFDCRRKGITIRSSIDCLIAQCAFEHELILLHHDRDFINLKEVMPRLEEKSFF